MWLLKLCRVHGSVGFLVVLFSLCGGGLDASADAKQGGRGAERMRSNAGQKFARKRGKSAGVRMLWKEY
jgi:hypothetical protein